jgi:uncharacterized membrane protein YGL010W
VNEWLEAYGVSHQNKTNKLIHWFCVPVITWTVIALLWSIQLGQSWWMNIGFIFIIVALVFYVRLSITLAIGMALFTAACLGLIMAHTAMVEFALWKTALALFVIAWVVQFVGHKIEGKKPSFLEDVQFLLIGPVWLLSFIYKKVGISV